MVHRSTTSLAPGFRFHPTDEELVSYYLKNKILGKPFRWDAISEVEVYRFEPWDLPVQSKLKSRDLEWYFFSVLDRKYGNGSRTNRTTDRGYWKTTGKDRAVKRGSSTVGMKKTLVYHCGRAPRGERTNWVMHEYKMAEEEISKSSVVQGVFVVCRIFQKSGSGPKNGEQYGAPFVEEEWDDENVEAAIVPGIDSLNEVPAADDDDILVEADDFDQELNMPIIPDDSNPPSNFYHHGGGTSHNRYDSQQPFPNGEEDGTGTDQAVTFSDCTGFVDFRPPEPHRNTFFCNIIDKNSAFFNPNECADEYTDLFLDEPYFDASDTSLMPSSASDSHFLHESKPSFASEHYLDINDKLMLSQGLFLEENDLTNPIEPGSCSSIPTQFPFEDYLSYFDDNAFESSTLTAAENSTTDRKPSSKNSPNEGDNPTFKGCGGAPFSEPEAAECKPEQDLGRLNPLMKYANNILGSIDAPPAYAAEHPPKDGVVRKSSSSCAVVSLPSLATMCTTGVLMQIHESMGMKWRIGKNGCVNCVLSLGIPQDVCCFGYCGGHGSFSGKLISVIMVTALVLCAASKIGSCC